MQEFAPDRQAIRSLLTGLAPYIHIWTKQADGHNDGLYFGNNVDGAEEYIARQNVGGFNCYFTFNIPTEDCGVKPFKSQIAALRGLHVDIDAPKNGEPFDKAATLATINAHWPTFVNDSGGGVHAYWLFPEPIAATPDNVTAVEAANRSLIATFNGDPAAPNVDRVMRVPGTVNWPDAKKRAAGRGPAMASVMLADNGAARPSLAQLQAHFAPAPQSAPPWVEVNFTWTPAHQLHAEGIQVSPGVLELAWTYTVDIHEPADRGDVDLTRAFHAAVRAALRRVAPDLTTPVDYIAVEVRRGYRSSGDRPTLAYVQLVGTNVTDLGDLWNMREPNALREALRDELLVVAALLHALGETFAPGGLGGYRSVDTA